MSYIQKKKKDKCETTYKVFPPTTDCEHIWETLHYYENLLNAMFVHFPI